MTACILLLGAIFQCSLAILTTPSQEIATTLPPMSNTSNMTTVMARYGVIPPDSSVIIFPSDDSREFGSTLLDTDMEKIIARGIFQLALQMDDVLEEDDKNRSGENIIFSPANIAAALAMVMLGSGGRTRAEIANALGLVSGVNVNANSDEVHIYFGRVIRKFQSNPGEQMSTYISMANGVFVQEGYPINQKYLQQSLEIYGSETLALDFMKLPREAMDFINSWARNKTFGRIPQILDYPPSAKAKVLIGSALYFNGAWEYPFQLEQTAWKPFYIGGKNSNDPRQVIQVVTMVQGADFPYYHDETLGCQIVGMPYKDNVATMYLVLPDEVGFKALGQLKNSLTVNYMNKLADQAKEKTVIVTVPRMQLESTIYLKHALKSLGVQSLFDPYRADLSKISTAHEYVRSPIQQNRPEHVGLQFRPAKSNGRRNLGLYVDDVVHKINIDITEKGTEAAAASVVSVTRDGSHTLVKFDRPFMFFIRHQSTGVVLFWGTVIRPQPNQKSQ